MCHGDGRRIAAESRKPRGKDKLLSAAHFESCNDTALSALETAAESLML
jgi:hypothetical protein